MLENLEIMGLHREAVRKLVSERRLRYVNTASITGVFREELAAEFDFFKVRVRPEVLEALLTSITGA